MKRIIILSILVLLVCSCEITPRDILLGSWEITVTMYSQASIGDITIDGGSQIYNYIYTFEENGKCRVINIEYHSVSEYTYFYNDLTKLMYFTNNERDSYEMIWTIDELTKNRIVAHLEKEDNSSFYSAKTLMTINGVKK